ncbi:hypothetical protein ACFO4E_07580 [Nocardiopsis mangrovi]|uniref:Secreted protein n=1 Tax=Nocardiopsis mangrovi TaxID=1179818 RepID=A0ABV9DTM5_9ACTN
MKRIVVALAAAGLVLAAAVPSHAAQGILRLGFQTIANPSGCYNSQTWPLSVSNGTDQPVTIYGQPDCQGDPLSVVGPGGNVVEEFGASVSVP